jgi:hypothetical protein
MRGLGRLLRILAILLYLGCIIAPSQAAGPAIALFDGSSLEGWSCFTVDPQVKMEDVWSVRDGLMVGKGEPLGYLYTNKDYTNYMLTVEWRWPPGAEPGNSGVLLRITGDAVSFLPKCAECQLKSGSAGDLLGFYGFKIHGPPGRSLMIEHDKLGRILGVRKVKGAEAEPGEWNKAEITAQGGRISVMINGEMVNEATDCDVVAGRIGLQSEGGEIHFRKVEIIPMD